MNYRKAWLLVAAIPLLAMPVIAQHGRDDDREREFRAKLRGVNEVPLTLSDGRGTLELTVNEAETSVHFVLEFSGLLTTVGAAHIHVGQPGANGGVTVFFCGGGGRPACPQQGVVEGDFTAANVGAVPTQQLEAGNLAKLLAAVRAGKTYANIHTMTSAGGEIRGQIKGERHDDDDR
jgi:hypothetical protein